MKTERLVAVVVAAVLGTGVLGSWGCSGSSGSQSGEGTDSGTDGSDDAASNDATTGVQDSGAQDGAPDTSAVDASADALPDSGPHDAGVDSTIADSGGPETGPSDASNAGAEAGPPPCTVEAGAVLNDALEISTGGYGQACAIRSDRSVVCWGQNKYGQAGESPDAAAVAPAPVTVHFPTDAGTILAEHVSCGTSISCILDQQSHVWCWGDDGYGQVGNGTVTDGGFGKTPLGPSMVVVPGGAPLTAIAISAGGQHACAMTPQDGIVCWGYVGAGLLPDAGTVTGFATAYPNLTLDGGQPSLSFGTGAYYKCASDSTGVLCWGDNSSGDVAPQQSGTTYFNGALASQITTAGGTLPLTSLGVGFNQACAIDSAHVVYCWGALGLETNEGGAQSLPVAMPSFGSGNTPLKVTVGYNFVCVLTTNGHAYCRGTNAEGQLGAGSLTPFSSSASPVLDTDGGAMLGGIVDISAGDNATCALLQSPCGAGGPGEVVCWGQTLGAQLEGYTDGSALGIAVPTPVFAASP